MYVYPYWSLVSIVQSNHYQSYQITISATDSPPPPTSDGYGGGGEYGYIHNYNLYNVQVYIVGWGRIENQEAKLETYFLCVEVTGAGGWGSTIWTCPQV